MLNIIMMGRAHPTVLRTKGKLMKKVIIIFLLTFFSPLTWACSCDIGDVSEKFKEHVSIFQGTVSELIFYEEQDDFGDNYIKVTFSIEKQWKGKPTQNKLLTVHNGASCYGYRFKQKQRYIIYAFEEGETLNTWWCGGVISQDDRKKDFEEEIITLNKLSETN